MFLTGSIKHLESKLFTQTSNPISKLDIIPYDSFMPLSVFEQNIIKIAKSFTLMPDPSQKPHVQLTHTDPSPIRQQDQLTAKEVVCPQLNSIKKSESSKTQAEEPQPMKKYTFQSANSSYIKVPPTYSTDELYQKHVIDYFNEGYDGWEKIDYDKRIEIYQKKKVLPPIVKSYFTVDFARETIVEAMSNFEQRKKWDEGFASAVLIDQVEEKDLQKQIIYFYIKSKMPFVDDREMIRLKTTWNNCPNDKTTLIHVTSAEHPNYPILKKVYRARVLITGYFIEELSPNRCSVGIINQLDLGMSDFLMRKVLPKTVYGWYDNVQNGCRYVLSHR